jgi:non-ribosomal peptide synthetase component E (peptide arylation enzyme)
VQVLGGSGHQAARRWAAPAASVQVLGGSVHQGPGTGRLRLLPSPLPSHAALIDSTTGESVSFPDFLAQVCALATALRSHLGVSRGDVAFVLAPLSLHVPVLYFALMAVGAIVSPANPALTTRESHLAALSKPTVAFTVSGRRRSLGPDLGSLSDGGVARKLAGGGRRLFITQKLDLVAGQ